MEQNQKCGGEAAVLLHPLLPFSIQEAAGISPRKRGSIWHTASGPGGGRLILDHPNLRVIALGKLLSPSLLFVGVKFAGLGF